MPYILYFSYLYTCMTTMYMYHPFNSHRAILYRFGYSEARLTGKSVLQQLLPGVFKNIGMIYIYYTIKLSHQCTSADSIRP